MLEREFFRRKTFGFFSEREKKSSSIAVGGREARRAGRHCEQDDGGASGDRAPYFAGDLAVGDEAVRLTSGGAMQLAGNGRVVPVATVCATLDECSGRRLTSRR